MLRFRNSWKSESRPGTIAEDIVCCVCVTVRLPVTARVLHSVAKTYTVDSAGYMDTVYWHTNNNHT